MNDYNNMITAVKNAATTEMMDTVVSVVGVGFPHGSNVTRQVQVSNPHVLKPVKSWPVQGGTPLYDGIGSMIDLMKSLPDANDPNVSFLINITTDGEESHSQFYDAAMLRRLIELMEATGRWTFAYRLPKQSVSKMERELGIKAGNIYRWDTTAAGMAKASVDTVTSVNNFYRARSAGATSTGAFYADASKVNVAALEDISKKVSLYVVPDADNGIEIRDFILKHRMEYLKGAAFYQLTKTEARVQHTKMILVRDRQTGKVFAGKEARQMIGLPTDRNARLHPGDHKNFDLFIQSESVNRKLVGGTGVVYWKEIGVPFGPNDLNYLKPAQIVVPAVVQLPKVAPTNKPTKSPIPIAKRAPLMKYFETREEARNHCDAMGIQQKMIKDFGRYSAPMGQRWAV